MAEWTEERKQEVIDAYMAGEPTANNSIELVKKIATDMNETPNGVRMVLMGAKVYIKKDEKKEGATKEGAKAPRVSKEAQIAALSEKLEELGHNVDSDILDKLTGKAATYFLGLFSK